MLGVYRLAWCLDVSPPSEVAPSGYLYELSFTILLCFSYTAAASLAADLFRSVYACVKYFCTVDSFDLFFMTCVTHPSFSFLRKHFGLPCSKSTISGMLTSQPRSYSEGESNFSISQLKDRSTKTKSSLGAILALLSFLKSSYRASS